MSNPDPLSDILRMVRLRACVYFVRDLQHPWGLDVPAVPNGPLHLVLDGRCVLRRGERSVALEAGDAVVLPRGAPHVLADRLDTPPEPGPAALRRLMGGSSQGNTGPDATRMLCGHFEWDVSLDHPLFRELPEDLVVRGIFDRADAHVFRSVVALIADEQASSTPGAAAVADRMGEVLFVSLLRAWMADSPPAQGVLAAATDHRLARALCYIHANHANDIHLTDLARIAGMSRTVFAVNFRRIVGMPPASYLTEWRLLQARRLLEDGDIAIAEVTERVGYGSDAAFVRAFKRRFGQTPARFRRAVQNPGRPVATSHAN